MRKVLLERELKDDQATTATVTTGITSFITLGLDIETEQ